jgi:multiple sugar transport system substrate-binding protein
LSSQYQQSPSPRDVGFNLFDRRGLFARGAGAALGASALGGLSLGATSAFAADDVSFGSNYSDPVPKAAMQKVIDKSGLSVTVNTVDHNTFQEQIDNYLQGTPDDVFTWFAGYRMQFFAAKGLAGDISSVWKGGLASSMSPALKAASTGADGKQYFVPFYYYPWAFFYRKSVFKAKGYTPPKTFDEFKALAAQMKKDGMVPIAFADKDGWPAMGTFDYINMRTNGYDFHVRLMAGKESWNSPKVKAVFTTWAELLPYHAAGSLGRTWQNAAISLGAKKTGMYLLGAFVGQQFKGATYNDLDFFAFPEINPKWGQDSVEAPIDGFMMSKKPADEAGAKKLLTFLGTPGAELTFLGADPNNIAASEKASKSKYNALQKKSLKLIGEAKHISQFLDRDTRPDFASTVMIPSLQQFIKDPKDINSLLKNIESRKKAIFAS